MKLTEYRVCTGVLHCVNGLRIGASKESIEVGGTDNPILRHPVTALPYVPGSSIKGKMRSLLEVRDGRVTQRGGPCDCGDCHICRVFGCSYARNSKEPTRIIVRDCDLTEQARAVLEGAQADKGIFFAEEKSEVIIDRKTGKAAGTGPRTQERVPAGTDFSFEIVLRIFEDDKTDEMQKLVESGLDLIQLDALGGSGSRGYGKVEFRDRKWETKAI